ncbi:Uncharacterised protein [Mycobacteroides abscessus subsp. abscessus]|nr:Uncharacterised protein [Mycobacteroides abscessus subsp. abscessus]
MLRVDGDDLADPQPDAHQTHQIAPERGELFRIEAAPLAVRIDPPTKQHLAAIHISHTGDDLLIHQ